MNNTIKHTINIKFANGKEQLVAISVPASLGEEARWRYICNWVDAHYEDAVEWQD